MKKLKIRAGLYLAATAMYIWVSALMVQVEIYIPACFALAIGLLCGYACMNCGRDIERRRWIHLVVENKEKQEAETGRRQIRCRNCGYGGFRTIAGRLICNCCGEVLENERE